MDNMLLFGAESNEILAQILSPGWIGVFAGVIAFAGALLAFRLFSRAGVIAAATTKEAIRQPLFLMILILSTLLLGVSTVIPYFSFGEDVKMLKDVGLVTILVSSLLLAIWTASTSVTDEIEGKTAMTLLSKPINRLQFVLGKYVGILQAVLLLIVILSVIFLGLVTFKPIYDAAESGGEKPEWVECISQAVQVIPGVLLVCMEAAIVTAISVAIATRLPMVVNMTACFAIFIVGHLTPVLVLAETSNRSIEVVQFVAQLIATVLPVLEFFKIEAAIARNVLVPPDYIGWSAVYCLAYVGAAILFGFILFEDRDLA
ncbi:ABC-2 transporter permease [Stratiformator vulcanicus]|uniref:ABC-2 family transporter protein n=1 Tax=Stratiformator vulcanicus TaxID=2527980 RepID=A0A517R6A9_9PLAN|nr:ABC-2 transporter permease [Stratiformator vulcanicus]QDT39392.1 ABC-2 family transporter protein [Stratiformator vulcanicus]